MIGDMDPDPSYGGGPSDYSYSYSSADDFQHACNYFEEEQNKIQKPLYTFYSLEELAKSEVFQQQLGMSLAHKDKEIERLRHEIMKLVYGEK